MQRGFAPSSTNSNRRKGRINGAGERLNMPEVVGPALKVVGRMRREDIVERVITEFIRTEGPQRGQGVKFRYPVEDLPGERKLFIIRPGGLQKWNFDFKVDVLPEFGLGKGTHKEMGADLASKKREDPGAYEVLLRAIGDLHDCTECDVDRLLAEQPGLAPKFNVGARIDVLLKVLKWMFIMEDIVYWNYKGRSKLYDEGFGEL